MAEENKNQVLLDAFKLAPTDAIKYLESKGYEITFDWHDMIGQAHRKAYTVAGVIKADVLKDIHDACIKSEKEGYSYSQFKADLVPTLIKKGWYGKQTITRPDGSTKEVDLSAPWRLKLIYNTNMRTSMMAGHYKAMMQSTRMRPYWRYAAILDGRGRDEHAKLHGKIFHYQDPFWRTYYPPNGWNCRCRVDSISRVEFERKGYKLDSGDDPQNQVKIEPEWAYNPALEEWQPDYGNYPPDIAQKLKEELDKRTQPVDKPMPQKPVEKTPGTTQPGSMPDAPADMPTPQKPVDAAPVKPQPESTPKKPIPAEPPITSEIERRDIENSLNTGAKTALSDIKDAEGKPVNVTIEVARVPDKYREAIMVTDGDKIIFNMEMGKEARDLQRAIHNLKAGRPLTEEQEFMVQVLAHEAIHVKSNTANKSFSGNSVPGVFHELGSYHAGVRNYPALMQKFGVEAAHQEKMARLLPVEKTLARLIDDLKAFGVSEKEFADLFDKTAHLSLEDALDALRKAIVNSGKVTAKEFDSWASEIHAAYRKEVEGQAD